MFLSILPFIANQSNKLHIAKPVVTFMVAAFLAWFLGIGMAFMDKTFSYLYVFIVRAPNFSWEFFEIDQSGGLKKSQKSLGEVGQAWGNGRILAWVRAYI